MSKLQKIILILMAAVMTGLLIAAAAVELNRPEPETIVNTFTPPEFDPEAQPGTPGQLDASLGYGTLRLTQTTAVSMCANVTLENGAARVCFTSPEGNVGWLKIKLLDSEGNLLGESGLIRPGEYVETVALTRIPEQSGLIIAKILIYEPDTYLSLGSATAEVMLLVD